MLLNIAEFMPNSANCTLSWEMLSHRHAAFCMISLNSTNFMISLHSKKKILPLKKSKLMINLKKMRMKASSSRMIKNH